MSKCKCFGLHGIECHNATVNSLRAHARGAETRLRRNNKATDRAVTRALIFQGKHAMVCRENNVLRNRNRRLLERLNKAPTCRVPEFEGTDPTERAGVVFLHCKRCLGEVATDVSLRDFARFEVSWTPFGFQVWCVRHECNVMHVDFEGMTHPASIEGKHDEESN